MTNATPLVLAAALAVALAAKDTPLVITLTSCGDDVNDIFMHPQYTASVAEGTDDTTELVTVGLNALLKRDVTDLILAFMINMGDKVTIAPIYENITLSDNILMEGVLGDIQLKIELPTALINTIVGLFGEGAWTSVRVFGVEDGSTAGVFCMDMNFTAVSSLQQSWPPVVKGVEACPVEDMELEGAGDGKYVASEELDNFQFSASLDLKLLGIDLLSFSLKGSGSGSPLFLPKGPWQIKTQRIQNTSTLLQQGLGGVLDVAASLLVTNGATGNLYSCASGNLSTEASGAQITV